MPKVEVFTKSIISKDTLPSLPLHVRVDHVDWEANRVRTVSQVGRDFEFW